MRTRTLAFARAALSTAAVSVFLASAQEPARPSFEVDSVRANKDNTTSQLGVRITPGRFTVQNLTLRRIVSVAYKVRYLQVSGGPSWADSEGYDIEANTAGTKGADEMLLMLRTLLEIDSKCASITRLKRTPFTR